MTFFIPPVMCSLLQYSLKAVFPDSNSEANETKLAVTPHKEWFRNVSVSSFPCTLIALGGALWVKDEASSVSWEAVTKLVTTVVVILSTTH